MKPGPRVPAALGGQQINARNRWDDLRELRIQHQGRPYRVLYAFDPRRAAILPLGGEKAGDNRWYEVNVPKADASYDEELVIAARFADGVEVPITLSDAEDAA